MAKATTEKQIRLDKHANPLAVDLANNAASTVSASTVSAKSAALSEGDYDIECDVACFVAVGVHASAAATSSSYALPASKRLCVFVREGHAIAVILAAGTGTLTIHKVR